MFRHRHRPHARPAAAMRHGKRFVQIQMTHIRADKSGIGQPYLRIHIGAIHKYQPAVFVYNARHFLYAAFKHTVRRRIRDHDTSQVILMLYGFFAQVVRIDVAVVITAYRHNVHAGHYRAGRIGAVRRRGNKRHIPVRIAVGLMAGADQHQAGIFAGRTRIGLQRHCIKAGNHGQIMFHFPEYLQVSLRLAGRRIRMNVVKFRPTQRQHFHCRIQFHRTGAQRNH